LSPPLNLAKKGFPYQDFASFFLVIESLGTYSRWEIDYKGMHDGITSDRISKKRKRITSDHYVEREPEQFSF